MFPVVMMAAFGLFFWAIRGTGGYGGSTGGLFAGIGWALCWYFLSTNDGRGSERPYGNRWAILGLAAGVAIGGFHGYGQFLSWIRGVFHITLSNPVNVDPVWGWLALLQCGLSWGGITGVTLGYAMREGKQDMATLKHTWMVRLVLGGAGAGVGVLIFFAIPGLLLPNLDQGYYADLDACVQCARTLETALSSSVQFCIFAGLLVAEIVLKKWRNVALVSILAAGFGIAFIVGTVWFFLPWGPGWKGWEMSIGAIGGAAIGISYTVLNRRGSAMPGGEPREFNSSFPMWNHFSVHRTRYETAIGMNAPITWGVAVAITNGLTGHGVVYRFFPGDEVANAIFWGIAAVICTPIFICFILSVKHARAYPASSSRPKPSAIGTPARAFIAVQLILTAIGFAASLGPTITADMMELLVPYAIAQAIGYGVFIITWLIDNKAKVQGD